MTKRRYIAWTIAAVYLCLMGAYVLWEALLVQSRPGAFPMRTFVAYFVAHIVTVSAILAGAWYLTYRKRDGERS